MKRQEDYEKAKLKREQEADYLNGLFIQGGFRGRFVRMHPYLKTMKVGEKAKNNRFANFIPGTSFHKAMGLHYVLQDTLSKKMIPFIFFYQGHGGIYLKVPKDYLQSPQSYLTILADMDYRGLIVSDKSTDDNRFYSFPISFKTIEHSWEYTMSSSRGNLNRLQFHGPLTKIDYWHPLQESGLGLEPCLLATLLNLLV